MWPTRSVDLSGFVSISLRSSAANGLSRRRLGGCFGWCGRPCAPPSLMLQDVLAEHDWIELLTPEDRRGLTPLFWEHVLPYGEVKLDMRARLSIRTAGSAGSP